jgi:hypothetical protein
MSLQCDPSFEEPTRTPLRVEQVKVAHFDIGKNAPSQPINIDI